MFLPWRRTKNLFYLILLWAAGVFLLAGCATLGTRPLAEVDSWLAKQRAYQAQVQAFAGFGQMSFKFSGSTSRARGIILAKRGGWLRLDLLDPNGQTGLSLAVSQNKAGLLLPHEATYYSGETLQASNFLPAELSTEQFFALLSGGVPDLESARPVHLGLDEASGRWRLVLEGSWETILQIDRASGRLLEALVKDKKTRFKISYADHKLIAGQPVPFSIMVKAEGGDEFEVRYQTFELKPDLPGQLFSLTVPPGFSRQPLTKAGRWLK